jgi:ribosomal protein S18 acetylase RimI-like enzyme
MGGWRFVTSSAARTDPRGVVLRECPGTTDTYAALAGIHRRAALHDGLDPRSALEPLPSAATIAARAAALADPARDQRVAEVDGRLVGHTSVVSWPEEDGTRVFLHRACLLPAYRGRGIGTALLGWAEGRARAMAAALPRDDGLPAGPDVLGGNAARTETEATALLVGHGYRPALRLGEYRLPAGTPLGEPPPPPSGIEVRPAATPGEYAALWELVELSYRGRPGVRVGSAAGRRRFVERAPSMIWLAAWRGRDPVGCTGLALVDGTAGPPAVHVLELSVHPGHRRAGLGRFLLLSGLRLTRSGPSGRSAEARLWTSLDGPQRAYALYESTGFEQVGEFVRYRRPLSDRAGTPD